jgi:prepilin-type N-terminal cleavage/methylation domain-containing protein
MYSESKPRAPRRPHSAAGFSLIELMVVLIIIAIFAALAVPQLVEVHRRNKLTDLTNMVEQSAAETRTFAMQTRRGAVLEVGTNGTIWINTLKGSDCWSDVQTRCMHNKGLDATTNYTNVFNMLEEHYVESGAYLCGVEVATIAGDACAMNLEFFPGDAFALCYSGRGDLYVRSGEDVNTACDGNTVPNALQDDWSRSCVITDQDATPYNGALLKFNRFDGQPSNCSAVSLGVTRGVHVPVGSAPYSKVEI